MVASINGIGKQVLHYLSSDSSLIFFFSFSYAIFSILWENTKKADLKFMIFVQNTDWEVLSFIILQLNKT